MIAGCFRKNTVSTGDLNRPRSPEVRKPLACFLVLFARRKKNVKTSPLQGVSRFSKPRISTPQPQLHTATIKTFQGSFEVLQTSNQHTKITTSHNPIKSFFRFADFSPPCGDTPGVETAKKAKAAFRLSLFAFKISFLRRPRSFSPLQNPLRFVPTASLKQAKPQG